MKLDIPTLALVQALILMVEVLILWVQFHSGSKYIGVRFWMTGSIVMAVGISLMPLVNFPNLLLFAVMGNPLYVLGLLLLHQGTVRFMNGRPRIWIIPVFFLLFLIIYIYFIVVKNSLWGRNLIVNLAHCSIFILISINIIKNTKAQYRKSSLYTAVVFIASSLFSILRILFSIKTGKLANYQELGISLPLAFLFYAIFSILWTFGFILIHHDRLSIKIPENKEEMTEVISKNLGKKDLYNLSERELEITYLLEEGLTYEQIATSCFISKNTVKTHIKNIYGKYNVNSRTNLLIKMKG